MSTSLEFTNLEIPKEIYQIPRINNSLLNERQLVNSTTHFELVPYQGLLRYIEGASYPAKGVPTPNAIFAINQIKLTIKLLVKYSPFLILVKKETLLKDFNLLFDKLFQPYVIKPIYMCPTAYYLYKTIKEFLMVLEIDTPTAGTFAHNLSHILEYDDAYRYRFQDIINEADLIQLQTNPRKEIRRLINIYKQREHNQVVFIKLERLITPILYLLYIPKVKKAFINSIHHIIGARPDPADLYWMSIRNDYLFGGKTYEERSKDVPQPLTYEITT